MEHEIYVPFSAAVVRSALTDPERVARCVPGLQPAPDGDPAAPGGRLRLRIGGSTITYRGGLGISGHGEGFTVEGEGSEARGEGTVRLTLTVVPRPTADGSGTTLSFTGTVEATGRLARFEPEQRQATGRRLLERFTEALVGDLGRDAPPGEASADEPSPPAGIGEPEDNERAIPGIPAPDNPPDTAPADGGAGPGAPGGPEKESGTPGSPPREEGPAPEGPESPESAPRAEEDLVGAPPAAGPPGTPEAGVARRTMIGRSAEEVDHAPPRGRYAPEPGPGGSPSGTDVLRWAAPAAALALVCAVAVGRALRRRS
ncbi:SRPBCC domain-containing protein [Streptomyces sodiiphilus]|uniref:SRPBCC domain-containing protein n=1 Tax=Streptomyces sodiiphilus TaxID=226217 RepID=A0ABP5A9N4_9ACTN